ncbi:TPA: LuxR C-terminal-related transcriptional regulator [Klebsiella variicola subsp. variicola]
MKKKKNAIIKKLQPYHLEQPSYLKSRIRFYIMTNYILLTNDYYLLLGLKEITHFPFVHINYSGGEECKRPVNLFGTSYIIIDNRIFLYDSYNFYKEIRGNIYGHTCYIWLDMLQNGCIYPIDSEKDFYLSFDNSEKRNPQEIKRKFSHIEIKMKTLLAMNKRPHLTKKELEISKQLLKSKNIHEIKKQFNLKEKTVRFHIKSIISKFGFKKTSHFVYFCQRNKDMVDEVLKFP